METAATSVVERVEEMEVEKEPKTPHKTCMKAKKKTLQEKKTSSPKAANIKNADNLKKVKKQQKDKAVQQKTKAVSKAEQLQFFVLPDGSASFKEKDVTKWISKYQKSCTKNGWTSVPQFGGWERKTGTPNYSMVFSQARANRKENNSDVRRTSLGNEKELRSYQRYEDDDSVMKNRKFLRYCCIMP